MMHRVLWAALFAVSIALPAAAQTAVPGLLPTEQARALLDQDPRVAAARSGLQVALEEAGILQQSPYEWIGKAQGQRRSLDDGSRYREWNVGVERTLRLPGKASADRATARATVQESQARYGEALQESAQDLTSLWIDWLVAERAQELAALTLQSVQDNLSAVGKRNRAGDASKLDLNLASAELSEQRRLENDAKTQAAAAWARMSARFPGVSREKQALPSAVLIEESDVLWRERILAQNDGLKAAQAQMRTAQALADRASADRTPDPTVGIYVASEAAGREKIVGVNISMPFSGGLRNARNAKALATVEVTRNAVDLKKRELEADIAAAYVNARGTYESVVIANESARAMQENARLTQRAYALGESDLQTLLLARRQATTAANSALQAQASALKAYYALVVDARLIWSLKSDS